MWNSNGNSWTSWLEIIFSGEAGHAGNTPMLGRKDALVAASKFVNEISKFPKRVSETAVATVGKLLVHPNGVNVIPGKVTLFVDIRDIHKSSRDSLVDMIKDHALNIGRESEIEVQIIEKHRVSPTFNILFYLI